MVIIHSDCILLAAGNSRRMGTAKQLLSYRGQALFLAALNKALKAFEHVILVQGAVDLTPWLQGIENPDRLEVVSNPDYERGQLESLRKGILASGSERVFVLLADLPLVKISTFHKLNRYAEQHEVLYPRHNNRRGHPVVFGKKAKNLIINAPAHKKAMHVVASLTPYAVDVDDSGIYTDIDKPEDYKNLTEL